MQTRGPSRLPAGWAVALVFLMLARSGHALPIDEALTIQPIVVCDSPGNCASIPSNLQDVLNAVWAQASIAPVLLTPDTVIMPSPTGGTGAMQVGLTTGSDNTIPAPDGFRLLTRTQGNHQSGNPNTINLYIVNTLSPFVNGNPALGQLVRGV